MTLRKATMRLVIGQGDSKRTVEPGDEVDLSEQEIKDFEDMKPPAVEIPAAVEPEGPQAVQAAVAEERAAPVVVEEAADKAERRVPRGRDNL